MKVHGVIADSGKDWVEVSIGPTSFRSTCTRRTAVSAGERHGEETCLVCKVAIRDDAISCYGFADQGELEAFNALVKIRAVGPAMALRVLSELTPGELSPVIQSELGYHLVETMARGEHQLDYDAWLYVQELAVQDWLTDQRGLKDIQTFIET